MKTETEEITGLVVVDVAAYGVSPSVASQIESIFVPMVSMLRGFEEQYEAVVSDAGKEVTVDICQRAKRLRLDIAKVRHETEKRRKEEKEDYLRAGKAIDGVANILKFAVTDKEDHLQKIETHFERIERDKLMKIKADRCAELAQYEYVDVVPDIERMHELVWANFISGVKKGHADKKEAERKAAEEAELKLKTEAEERERMKIENVRLKAEAAERDRLAEKERKASEAKLAEEREKRDKIQKELLAKNLAEAQERDRIQEENRERLLSEHKARTAPDRIKLENLAHQIREIEKSFPVVSSEKAKTILDEARKSMEIVAIKILEQSEEI